MTDTTDIEKTNLETHVELCALRYRSLDKRLLTIENKVEGIENKVGDLKELVQKSHMSMIKVLVATAGTVVTGVISTVVLILLNVG